MWLVATVLDSCRYIYIFPSSQKVVLNSANSGTHVAAELASGF